MKRSFIFGLCWLACSAWGETEIPLKKVAVGTDLPTLQRGAETVMTVCTGCHSLKYIRFRELAKLGIAKDKVDGWRGSNPMGTTIASQMPSDAAMASFQFCFKTASAQSAASLPMAAIFASNVLSPSKIRLNISQLFIALARDFPL